MDGYTAAAEIRKLSPAHLCQVPILAVTAHATLEDQSRCLAVGMNQYLSKPVSKPSLLRAITAHIKSPSALSGRQPPAPSSSIA